MPELIINLLESDADTGAADKPLKASITHLKVSEYVVDRTGLFLESSPGILLVTPSHAGARVQAGQDTFDVPRDMVLVARGRDRKEVFAALADPQESPAPKLQVIELNARLNDHLDLVEIITPPFLLDYESSEPVINFLHRQSTFSAPIMIPAGRADASGLFMAAELLGCVLRAAGEAPARLAEAMTDDRKQKLKAFLLSHIDQKVSAAEMAEHLGMSRSGFGSWCRKLLECPPSQYLKELRLDQAQEWLAQGRRNMEQIAESAGFSDRFAFSKAFKQRFGLPPGQYARARGTAPRLDFLTRAANLYHRHRFERALSVCEEGLQVAAGDLRDRLRYQKSLCLLSLGQTSKAMAEWRALESSSCALEAGVRLCRHLFTASEYDAAFDVFRKVYSAADGPQQERLVPLWIDQVLRLRAERRVAPLYRYLALRDELFPADHRAVNVAVDCWRDLGENELVYTHFKEYPQYCSFLAMRRAGKPDEALTRFKHVIPKRQVAFTLHHFGRHNEVLSCEPRDPRHSAEALTELGRPEEAIDRYPDHCESAYLALGRYEALVERFPEPSPEYVYALHALKRFDDLKQFQYPAPDPWVWYIIQLYICPDAILEAEHPDSRTFVASARLLKALADLQQGDRSKAVATLEQIDGVRTPEFWWGDHNSTELLLVSLTRALLGDRQGLQADLDDIAARQKFKDEQILWHDAGYLGGTVSAATYKRQPQQSHLAQRFTLIQAAAHDLEGQPDKARAVYEHYLAASHPYPQVNLLRHRFVEWRLKEL